MQALWSVACFWQEDVSSSETPVCLFIWVRPLPWLLKCRRIFGADYSSLALRCVWVQCVRWLCCCVSVFLSFTCTHFSPWVTMGFAKSTPEDLSAGGLRVLSPLLVEKGWCWNILTLFWILIPCLLLWFFFLNVFIMNNMFDLFFSV